MAAESREEIEINLDSYIKQNGQLSVSSNMESLELMIAEELRLK